MDLAIAKIGELRSLADVRIVVDLSAVSEVNGKPLAWIPLVY